MVKSIVTLVLVCVALLSGGIYMHLYNAQNPHPEPILLGATTDTPNLKPVEITEDADDANEVEEEVEELPEEGIPFGPLALLSEAGFDPLELIVGGTTEITIRNTTSETILVGPTGIDCATSPAECDLLSPGADFSETVSANTSYTTNTGHTLVITVQ